MKKIDKGTILSKEYKDWWESDKVNYPKYDPHHRFYLQVKMSLLHCQNGLCAYTEKRLCSVELCASENWNEEGKYANEKKTDGDVEHFDSTKKTTGGWDWDNLFVTRKVVNNTKRASEVDNVLKPDMETYDPNNLEYDCSLHIFYVKRSIRNVAQLKKIKDMILTLGLNHDAVIDDRKEAFRKLKLILEFENADYDYVVENIIAEFPTVFEKCRSAYVH